MDAPTQTLELPATQQARSMQRLVREFVCARLDDCMNVMAEYPDGHFDLAICDPPYGIKINMNMGRKKGQTKAHVEKAWDDQIPSDEYFAELRRVSKNQIIWGGNYFPLPKTKAWIFWDKLVPDGVDFADGELAWTSFDKTLRKITVPYSGFVGSEGKIHPTQKPVKLYSWLLAKYAKPGQRILDTHMGSGSIGIACHYYACPLVACEIDPDYFRAACDRIERETAQADWYLPNVPMSEPPTKTP
jgi:site-specific DNA-methyltransferase (adenine-specific)